MQGNQRLISAASEIRILRVHGIVDVRTSRAYDWARLPTIQLGYIMGFGTYIRQKREAKNMAMNEFARLLDISPAYWSRIEREMEKPPKDELIRRAAEILGEDPDQAFIEASRLPPDMREDMGDIVRMYRKRATGDK